MKKFFVLNSFGQLVLTLLFGFGLVTNIPIFSMEQQQQHQGNQQFVITKTQKMLAFVVLISAIVSNLVDLKESRVFLTIADLLSAQVLLRRGCLPSINENTHPNLVRFETGMLSVATLCYLATFYYIFFGNN